MFVSFQNGDPYQCFITFTVMTNPIHHRFTSYFDSKYGVFHVFSKVFHGFSKVFHGFPPPLDIQSLLQVFFFRLAKAAGGLQARLVQEWLAQQAAAGLLDFDPKKGRLGRKEHQKSG